MGLLSLQDVCLFSIRNLIENGQCPPTDFLPPTLRQRILETIYKHGTIDNPKCIDVLGSVEYLQGFARINTQKVTNDAEFLEKLATSFAQVDPNTKAPIGDAIEQLDLHIYNANANASYNSVVRLISKCPNLKTFNANLDGADPFGRNRICWPVLNRSPDNDQCRSVLENINKLSIVAPSKYSRPYNALHNDSPLLEFRALTSLKLESCVVDPFAWRKLLESTQNTLRILSVINVGAINDIKGECKGWILPLSMPQVTDFEYLGTGFLCAVPPKQVLACDALERVRIETYVDDDEMTEDELDGLSSIQQSVTSLELSVSFGTDSFNEIVNIADQFFDRLGPSVKSLKVTGDNTVRKIAAISRCPNLAHLKWIAGYERKADFSSLAELFRDHVRAEKLRELSVWGHLSRSVFDVLFENCRNLQKLSINRCSKLSNRHLIDLASHCDVLEKVEIADCDNVGDRGLTAILIARGSRLVEFVVHHMESMTYITWKTLIDRCPNVAKIGRISDTLEEARQKKSFYQFVDVER